ncbi:TPA: hypothetical protein ACPZMC_003220 [Yersinia enterocolitica]|uniref:hypothetical protein n=1 Tax=Yersinia TaxID=629 RepID=UPI0006808625|nr:MULTISPECIES: hypothetical protein [Yersinia]EKN3403870.1 hypothetical protein [Yersinia enterocolitica]EKN3717212.1 hypothetical protein [Yersinia enterocolitica]EKN4045418.1 hypothetical protein [Yersinia enterocolitica]EKN4823138.1 hypothetical protein [Yersinia enterocolitica]EKN4831146.1 hypothetical protein [Yersinia enterocolitica]
MTKVNVLELSAIFDDIANLLDASERLRIRGGSDGESLANEITAYVINLAAVAIRESERADHEI